MSKFAALVPGVYITTQDIDNPNADRRVKRDWRNWPVIPKGTRFVITRYRGWEDQYPDITFWQITAHDAENRHSQYLIANENVNRIAQHALAHEIIRHAWLHDDDARFDEQKDEDIRDAAHDLLSALEAIMASVAGCQKDAIYENARAAIAKARGLTQEG